MRAHFAPVTLAYGVHWFGAMTPYGEVRFHGLSRVQGATLAGASVHADPHVGIVALPDRQTDDHFPMARFDLVEEVRQLRASPIPHGHLAKTILHNDHLRVVLMVLQRGARLPRHHAKGSLNVHVLDGRVIITLFGSSFDLGANSVLAIDPEVAHAVVATEDSALLFTIAF
jgi:quercetin dioxygenase-like cupin family protein